MPRPSRRAPRTEASSRSLLQAHGLTFAPHPHRGKPLFRDLSLSIHPGEIVALVGANGTGKTTLLRCLAGELSLDHGTVQRAAELQLASVAQSSSASASPCAETVRARLWTAQTDLAPLLDRLDHDWSALDEWQQGGGYEREARIEQHAHLFGIDTLLEQDCTELSLGQLRKVDLVAALSSPAQLLLLDEPLNYLDLQGILAFENDLLERRQNDSETAALLISHDRELLDRVADRTLHLTSDGLLSVKGGYSAARQERQRQQNAQSHRADEMRKRIRSLERQFRQRKSWAERKERSKKGAGAAKPFIAKRAKKMMKRAKDLERRRDQQLADLRAEAPEKQRPVKIETPAFPVARRGVALLEDVSKSFEGKEVLRSIDLRLETASRIALLGANGAGKSTLLRLVLGLSEPTSGAVTRNQGVRIGVLPQNLEGFFTGPRLIDDFLGGSWPQSEARKRLGSIGLRRERVFQAPETLTQGERMRAPRDLTPTHKNERRGAALLTTTLESGSKLGSYEILRPLGAGGMGEVYCARDPRLEREVAIKVLPARWIESRDARARFEREAKAVAALSHPNILAIHEFGTDGEHLFAVMELLEGETLRERLASSGARRQPRR